MCLLALCFVYVLVDGRTLYPYDFPWARVVFVILDMGSLCRYICSMGSFRMGSFGVCFIGWAHFAFIDIYLLTLYSYLLNGLVLCL